MSSGGTVLSFTEWKTVEAEKAACPKERWELVEREVYGKETPLNETEELTKASLRALQKELRDSVSPAYRRAVVLCSHYVKSEEFCLMFLRAERFKPKAAARRMEKYWEHRLLLFGEEIAFEPRPIWSADLSDEDLATLRNNGIQLLPRKDKAGRTLIISSRAKWLYRHETDIGRVIRYLVHVALEDVVVQKNGFVFFGYDDGKMDLRHFDRKLDKFVIGLAMQALPMRLIAVHHCFDSKVVELLMPFLFFLLGVELRLRYKHHPITRHDTAYFLERLEEFGILPDMLPDWVNGGMVEFETEIWLEQRKQKEGVHGCLGE